MRLYVDISRSFECDLVKARAGSPGGGPRTAGGAKFTGGTKTGNPGGGARTGGPKTGTRSSTPKVSAPATPSGALPPPLPRAGQGPTPGSSSTRQLVDCPLGPACDKGGKHFTDSEILKEHQALAQRQSVAEKPEESGKDEKHESAKDQNEAKPIEHNPETGGIVGEPGVTPSSSNIGSIGSDVAEKPKPFWEQSAADPAVSDRRARRNRMKNLPFFLEKEKSEQEDLGNAKTEASGKISFSADGDTLLPTGEAPSKWNAPTPPEDPFKNPPLVLGEPSQAYQKKNDLEEVPNPLVPGNAPEEATPMDHYRLAKLNRDLGDDEAAQLHEALAQRKSKDFDEAKHEEIIQTLKKEGMHDYAKRHRAYGENLRSEAEQNAEKKKLNERYNKREQAARKVDEVYKDQAERASSMLAEAKKKHEETKKKAEEIKAANKKKLEEYNEQLKEYETKKAAKEQGIKKPVKPRLEKEIEVPDRPELDEPRDDAERLRHTTHTDKAKAIADRIASHLKNNPDLPNREKLEIAHKIAAYHASIKHVPSAEHRAELSEVERAAKEFGVSEHWDDIKAREDKENFAELDRKIAEHSARKQDEAKQAEKQQKQEKGEEAKQEKNKDTDEGNTPESAHDHAVVQDHRSRASNLKQKIQYYMDNNADISEAEKAKLKNVLTALEMHESMEKVPTTAHRKQLNELHRLAGPAGKDPKEPKALQRQRPGTRTATRTQLNYLFGKVRQGASLGAALAHAAENPRDTGQVGQTAVNYAGSGVLSAGHKLLHDTAGSPGGKVTAPADKAKTPANKEKPEDPVTTHPVEQEASKDRRV